LVAVGAAASTANGGAAFGDGAVETGSWAGPKHLVLARPFGTTPCHAKASFDRRVFT
jgi:hypothetical protein